MKKMSELLASDPGRYKLCVSCGDMSVYEDWYKDILLIVCNDKIVMKAGYFNDEAILWCEECE